LANMTVRVYLSRSRRCPLKVSTWIVSIAGRRSCPAAWKRLAANDGPDLQSTASEYVHQASCHHR
jgi:hypothetical protein